MRWELLDIDISLGSGGEFFEFEESQLGASVMLRTADLFIRREVLCQFGSVFLFVWALSFYGLARPVS